MRRYLVGIPVVLVAVGLGLVACGGDKPKVQEPTPTAVPAPPPVSASAAQPEPSAAPLVSASASSAPSAAPVPRPSGPIAMYTSDKEIANTFGTPGAILALHMGPDGDATLKIPPGALRGGLNVSWRFENAAKGFGTTLGRIVGLTPNDVESATPKVVRVESAGPPFEVRFPTFGKDTVNLAVGDIEDSDGKQKITWTVYAPKSVDTGKKIAYFDVTHLGPSFFHVTLSAPTPPKP